MLVLGLLFTLLPRPLPPLPRLLLVDLLERLVVPLILRTFQAGAD